MSISILYKSLLAKTSSAVISKIAEVGFASRFVSIFDHFIEAASSNKRELRNALSRLPMRETKPML